MYFRVSDFDLNECHNCVSVMVTLAGFGLENKLWSFLQFVLVEIFDLNYLRPLQSLQNNLNSLTSFNYNLVVKYARFYLVYRKSTIHFPHSQSFIKFFLLCKVHLPCPHYCCVLTETNINDQARIFLKKIFLSVLLHI